MAQHDQKTIRGNNQSSSHYFKYTSLSILNHFIWSMNPVLSRYLQVKIGVRWDIVLSSTRIISMVSLFIFGDFFAKFNSWFVEVKENDESLTTTTIRRDDNDDLDNDNNEHYYDKSIDFRSSRKLAAVSLSPPPVETNESGCANFKRKRFINGLSFALVSTIRASSNFASFGFTLAYNISLIQSLSPLAISYADSIVLKTKLPKIIWPTLFMTIISCGLVVMAQSPQMNKYTNNHDGEYYAFSQRDVIGCALSAFSMLSNVICRLLMKTSAETHTPEELVQLANVGTVFVPLVYSLVTYPSGWVVLFHNLTSLKVVAAWMTTGIVIFSIAGPVQIVLVRVFGVGLYSSLVGVRVLGSIFFSILILDEPIHNVMEYVGIVLTIATITVYVRSLSLEERSKINTTTFSSSVDDSEKVRFAKPQPQPIKTSEGSAKVFTSQTIEKCSSIQTVPPKDYKSIKER